MKIEVRVYVKIEGRLFSYTRWGRPTPDREVLQPGREGNVGQGGKHAESMAENRRSLVRNTDNHVLTAQVASKKSTATVGTYH